MEHIKGMDRKQVLLFPEVIDDYITDENPVKFMDANRIYGITFQSNPVDPVNPVGKIAKFRCIY